MKLQLMLVFAFFILIANAQKNLSQINSNFSDGTISITQYAANIFKLSFHSPRKTNNQNIDDAVVLQPLQKINTALINDEDAYLSFGKEEKAKLLNASFREEYCMFQFDLDDDEKIYGGGERALPLNRRGYRFNLYNNPWYGYGEGADNLNFSLPFFTSSKGYGLFFDNGSKGYADIGKTKSNILEVGFVSGEMNVYVILGKSYKEILTSYMKLTGTQPLPPLWAMGNFMSRFGYESEKQVTSIAAAMQLHKIPVDAIIFDLFWFGDSIKGTLGNLDWINTHQWPNPQKMIHNFKSNNINTILITEPFMLQGTKQYNASLPYLAKDSLGKPFIIPDFYFGKGGLLDIFRKDVGDWIWNIHYKKQIANGVKGWWTDLGEPEKHPSAMMHNAKDEGVMRMLYADEIHNLYGHYWNKNLFEHYAKDFPNERLFHLNRSGFAGSQRYSIFPWTGDVSRSWTGLNAQLPNLLGMSMCGIPYIHSDAGGFAGGNGDNELYVRWLQFAAFTPIFRPHGTALYAIDKNAFSFPSEPALIDSPYCTIAKSVVDLRYKMLPYNYTLAYRQAKYGEPLIRPLYYEYSHDTIALNKADEFMWGDEILVAPVLQKAMQQRQLYLPEGKWFDWNNNIMLSGKQNLNYSVTLSTIPLFIKEGSFLPMYLLAAANVSATAKNMLSVVYIPSTKKSAYVFYEDDGENKKAIEQHQYQLTTFTSSGIQHNKIIVNIKSNGSEYANKPNQRQCKFIIPLPNRPKQVILNKKLIAIDANLTNNNANSIAEFNDAKQQLIISVVFTPYQLNTIEVDL